MLLWHDASPIELNDRWILSPHHGSYPHSPSARPLAKALRKTFFGSRLCRSFADTWQGKTGKGVKWCSFPLIWLVSCEALFSLLSILVVFFVVSLSGPVMLLIGVCALEHFLVGHSIHACITFFSFDPGTCFSLWYVPFFDSYYDKHTYMICLHMQCIGCQYIYMYTYVYVIVYVQTLYVMYLCLYIYIYGNYI